MLHEEMAGKVSVAAFRVAHERGSGFVESV
jgi:hypothetical protein